MTKFKRGFCIMKYFYAKQEVKGTSYKERKLAHWKRERERKRKKRIMDFVMLITLFLVLVSGAYLGLEHSRLINSIRQDAPAIEEAYDMVSVTVAPGETAWDIQKRLTPNEDVRELLYYGGKVNEKSMGDIKAGESLIFLKTKERN